MRDGGDPRSSETIVQNDDPVRTADRDTGRDGQYKTDGMEPLRSTAGLHGLLGVHDAV